LVWGVGRHVMGSQIFDYWYDPSKFMLEHYGKSSLCIATLESVANEIVVDGDLVDETTPTSRSEAGPDNLHVWGPPLPPTFLM